MENARDLLVRWMDESSKDGLWAAAWPKALEGLTPQQAAWKPAPERRSIWQIVNHITFWREHEIRNLAGEKPGPEEVERRNFEEPQAVTEAAWDDARERFAQSHKRIRDLIADERTPLERVQYLIPHDAYHIGQIMTLRALQGLPPIV